MIKLRRNSGLDLSLDLNNLNLILGKDIVEAETVTRNVSGLKGVLLDYDNDSEGALYYMHKGISLAGDCERIKENNLRYDVTVIASGFLGEEFVKTFGHYHFHSYPEVYEILWGEAVCVLQKSAWEDPLRIEDVILVRAKSKEKIVIPPDYGHILINPSVDIPLVAANWVSSKCRPDYSIYKEAKGAAYFVTNDDGEFKFTKNKAYGNLADIRIMRSVMPIEELGLYFDTPIYGILKTIKKLDFLNNPDKYNFDRCFAKDKRAFSAIPL